MVGYEAGEEVMCMTLDTYRPEFEKIVQYLQHELQQIRTGRATPALVEDIPIAAYGASMRVKELATITCPDARTIQIDAWDASVMRDIERGIRQAQATLNPVVDGKTIRVPMPELTEETRRELTKRIGQKVEEAKQRVRRVRDDVRKAILEAERAKELPEDDRFRMQKKLDELTETHVGTLKSMGEQKEREVMTM